MNRAGANGSTDESGVSGGRPNSRLSAGLATMVRPGFGRAWLQHPDEHAFLQRVEEAREGFGAFVVVVERRHSDARHQQPYVLRRGCEGGAGVGVADG